MINLGLSAFLKSRDGQARKTVIKIPSDVRQIAKVSSKILEDLARKKVTDSLVFDIRLCIEEAVRNAIVHGNKSAKALPVRVSYWFKDDTLTIEVEDRGGGFDRDKIPNPTIGDNILKNSGRGVYLMKNIMDEVTYNEKGNLVRMTKGLAR